VEDRRQGSALAEYRTRLAARGAEAALLDRRHATLAWIRLGVFFSATALVAVLGRSSAPWLAIPAAAFLPLLFIHARVLNARDRATRAAAFYERGLARLEDRWQGAGERGERFRNQEHLYAEDLDVFGPGGLFELLVTARTTEGEALLASWLLAPADPVTIRERQRAVMELAPRLDLHEDLAVLGPDLPSARTDDLRAWAAAPPQLEGNWPRFVLPLVALVSGSLVIRWIWTGDPPDALVPALVIQGLLARVFRRRAHRVAHGIEERKQDLDILAVLMERIEREAVESPRLRSLRDRLRATGRSPAAEIRRLARLVEIIESSHNLLFAPISALLLLGTQLAFAIERWRTRCGPLVPQWLAAVAEYEALSALGTYAAEHTQDPFPEIIEGPALFAGESVAHPLLPPSTAVPNDVRLGGSEPRLLIVSGSNMSGKSTLLRTVGLNAVLAQAGAPVRARRLTMSPLHIGGTLRIQDSLQAGRSRFFAEISRISAIVSLTSVPSPATSVPGPPSVPAPTAVASTPVLFLLDELLSGTNSHDRLAGATGILSGLVERGAIGLATTHDLALTVIADRMDGHAANVHFEDQFQNGVLTFDYRLKPGVVKTSNALALMRAVGLDV
jgi:hypothetical protein